MGYLCKYMRRAGWEPVVVTEQIDDSTFSFLKGETPVTYVNFFHSKGKILQKLEWICIFILDYFFHYKDKPAEVVLAAAAALYFGWRAARGSKGTGLEAVVDFGSGASETLSLDEDHDYLYDVGDYVVHLQVKDGAIAFLDSQCPDHICEQFGWLDKDGAWAACVPAGVYVVVQEAAS